MESNAQEPGLSLVHLSAACRLIDAAFGAKLGAVIPSAQKRLRFFEFALNRSSLFAEIEHQQLRGILGIKFADRAPLRGVSYGSLVKQLGIFDGSKAALFLTLF